MAETQPLVESKIDSYGAVGGDVEGPRREREFAFATPGVLPRQQDGDLQRSRDKSVHVTDEVRGCTCEQPHANATMKNARPRRTDSIFRLSPGQVFNTASHFMALMLSILGSTVLIVRASEEVRLRSTLVVCVCYTLPSTTRISPASALRRIKRGRL